MPTLTLTFANLSDPASKAEVQQCFSEILALLNGGLDDSNFAAIAGLQNAKLDANDYEFLVKLKIQPTTGATPPTSTTIPIDITGLPGSTTDGVAYTVISANYSITDAGTAGNTTYKVQLGYFAAGVWTAVGSDIITSTNIAGGTNMQSGSATLTTTDITLDAAIQYHLALFLTATGTGALDTAYGLFEVTLKLRRTAGLR